MTEHAEERARATRAAIEASVRVESPRVIGALVRILRDVALAEDLAQEALLAALESWPETGIPERPGAWLVTAAKRRAIDELRRRERLDVAHATLAAELRGASWTDASLEEPTADDVLRLMLVSCHPVLSMDARVALTLRLVSGLSTDEIARAYLVSEPTIAQRIVRAKKTIAAARVPFEVPEGVALVERLGAVREVLYLVFNEGYAASGGHAGPAPSSAKRRLASDVSSWPTSRTTPRPMACSRSWSCRPLGYRLVTMQRGGPCSCRIRIVRAGIAS